MSTSRPSAGQAIVIVLSAIALLVTACFGALGVGTTFTGGVVPAVGALVLTVVAALGLTGFLVGVVRFIGAVTRTIRGTPDATADAVPPAVTPGASPAALSGPQVPPGRRPSFGQALVIFAAGLVVFSGACIGLVDGGRRSDASAALWTLLLAAATATAVWGFASMVWGRRPVVPASADAVATPSAAGPPHHAGQPPTAEPPAEPPPAEEPRA